MSRLLLPLNTLSPLRLTPILLDCANLLTMFCKFQVTIRKIARDRKMLLDVADPYALEGGAMHVAALQMDHSSLDLLLELNASPNARNGSGLTPMHSILPRFPLL